MRVVKSMVSSLLLYHVSKPFLDIRFSVTSASFLGALGHTTLGLGNTDKRSTGFGNVFVVVRHFQIQETLRITLKARIVFCIHLGCLISEGSKKRPKMKKLVKRRLKEAKCKR